MNKNKTAFGVLKTLKLCIVGSVYMVEFNEYGSPSESSTMTHSHRKRFTLTLHKQINKTGSELWLVLSNSCGHTVVQCTKKV